MKGRRRGWWVWMGCEEGNRGWWRRRGVGLVGVGCVGVGGVWAEEEEDEEEEEGVCRCV